MNVKRVLFWMPATALGFVFLIAAIAPNSSKNQISQASENQIRDHEEYIDEGWSGVLPDDVVSEGPEESLEDSVEQRRQDLLVEAKITGYAIADCKSKEEKLQKSGEMLVLRATWNESLYKAQQISDAELISLRNEIALQLNAVNSGISAARKQCAEKEAQMAAIESDLAALDSEDI